MSVPQKNERLLEAVRQHVNAHQFTGRVILHCHEGEIRKVEQSSFTRAEDIDGGGLVPPLRGGDRVDSEAPVSAG